MGNTPSGAAQYLTRFGEQTIVGSQYALGKLGVDRANCSLKIEEYIILCVPFQLGFKRSIFLASLSKQELAFFQKYANSNIGLSIALNPNNRPEPLKFFLRCTLSTLGQMKGRENVGLFVVDYKTSPDELVKMLGNFLENQELRKAQYNDFGNTVIKITPDICKVLGYNNYATIAEPNSQSRRIQISGLSSKSMEYLEAQGAPERIPGTTNTYQLFFQKYRVNVSGTIKESSVLPQGIKRTVCSIDFSPELIEILDEYWYSSRGNPAHRAPPN